MLEIGLPRVRMTRGFLQDVSRAVSRFSRGPFAENQRQHIFYPTGLNTIAIVSSNRFFDSSGSNMDDFINPVGSKK